MQANHDSASLILCPHCQEPGKGQVCSECGEDLHPKRITFFRILKDIPDVFFDLEFGLLYTLRTFITRPGREIREYFAGDRQKHYKPLKFILFMGGLVTLLMVTFNITDGREMTPMEEFSWQWNSAILIFQFPIISILTWLIFKKRKYTFGEHLMANAFLIGEVITFYIIFFPALYYFNKTIGVTVIQFLYSFWILGYYTYAFYDWFYHKKTAAGFFKSLGVTIFIFVTVMIITVPIQYLFFHLTK